MYTILTKHTLTLKLESEILLVIEMTRVNLLLLLLIELKGMQRILKKNYIMDENDSLSDYIKIPLATIVPVALFIQNQLQS